MPTPATTRRVPLKGQRGQSIVEFVFVLPFMLVLLFGVVDFGMALNTAGDLNHVAASTARKLAVNSDPSFDPVAYAKSIAEPQVRDNPTLVVEVGLPSGTTPGPDAAVCVKLKLDQTIRVIPGFPGAGPTLSPEGKAAMRLETPASFAGSGATTATACD